jgi:UDPglucose--hexose-1-phosphate uridylyltransferase
MLAKYLNSLIDFSINTSLIEKRDYIYKTNKLFLYYHLVPKETSIIKVKFIYEILDLIISELIINKILNDNYNEIEKEKSIIMDIIIHTPSIIDFKFNSLYKKSPSNALDWFYKFSINSYDIKMDKISKNKIYVKDNLIVTINLSKPEKDPTEIAKIDNSNYPKCQLCDTNEGYNTLTKDPKLNHRMVSLSLNNETWYFQYSPYAYYNCHCIVLTKEHRNMKISRNTFSNLLDLLDYFPNYFFGSNADIPISGGSILNHEHYQGGVFHFPLEDAPVYFYFHYKDIELNLMDWPLNVIRLKSKNKESLVDFSSLILDSWRSFSNVVIKGLEHNSITPISRKNNDVYELDLVLRNNETSARHPLGIFHPHVEIWHIKKENIGLIEVMGLAILPGRLINELNDIKDYINNGIYKETISSHLHFIEENNMKSFKDNPNIDDLIIEEVKKEFLKGLSHCKVLTTQEFFTFIKNIIGRQS